MDGGWLTWEPKGDGNNVPSLHKCCVAATQSQHRMGKIFTRHTIITGRPDLLLFQSFAPFITFAETLVLTFWSRPGIGSTENGGQQFY